MFFSKKIKSIGSNDKVLEIGPGATPHPRSNAFLEITYDTDQIKISQRGAVLKEPDFGNRPAHYYEGGRFPFADNQFDYVICSHVIEHVPDPAEFMAEVFRVGGGRGYLEYPLITYEYLYDFDVHLHFVKFDFEQGTLKYLPKIETDIASFSTVTAMFNKTLVMGWDDLCAGNKEFFFEGVEFNESFLIEKTIDLGKLLPTQASVYKKGFVRRFLGRLINKLGL